MLHKESIEKQLFAVKHLTERCSLSRTTIHRMVKTGQFPPPLKLSSGCVRWRKADIEAWEQSHGEGEE